MDLEKFADENPTLVVVSVVGIVALAFFLSKNKKISESLERTVLHIEKAASSFSRQASDGEGWKDGLDIPDKI